MTTLTMMTKTKSMMRLVTLVAFAVVQQAK
jgi:hypothetical protein